MSSVEFVLFNISGGAGHLWYVRELIYVYLIYIFLIYNKKQKFIFPSILFVYIISIFTCKYSDLIFKDINFYTPIIKSLVLAYMCVSIGYLINKYHNRITNIKGRWLIIIFLLNTIEYILLNKYDFDKQSGIYIFTIPLTITVFIYFLNNVVVTTNNLFAKIGRKYSTGIYVFHILFIKIFNIVFKSLSNNLLYIILRTPMVFLITLAFVYFLQYIKKKHLKL